MSGIDDRLSGLLATIEARQIARLCGLGPVDELTDPDRMKASAIRWLQRERELRQSIRGYVTCLRMAQGNRRAAVRLSKDINGERI